MKKCYNYYISHTLGPQMEENPKIFWRHVNRGIKRDTSSGTTALRHQDQLISEAVGKCELLNSYFKSVFTKEDTTTMPVITSTSFPVTPDFTITPPGVENLLSELKVNKAARTRWYS